MNSKLIKFAFDTLNYFNPSMNRNKGLNRSLDIEKKKLSSFPNPYDNFDRSYYQYKCQILDQNIIVLMLFNLASFLVLPFILIHFRNKKNKTIKKVDLIFFKAGKSIDILNEYIIKAYPIIIHEFTPDYKLENKDLLFIKLIWRKHPISFYFLLKNVMNIAMYRDSFGRYNCNAICNCNEYSFSSSILTEYCNNVLNCKHINVMHGEKLFYIRDAFVKYNEFYVWAEEYKNLFIKLRADPSQFIIASPRMFTIEKKVIDKKFDFKYYLIQENKKSLEIIYQALLTLKERGYNVAIRIHPRYSDLNLINDIFKEIHIEHQDIDINESILESEVIIGKYTTVLNQAFHLDKKIVFDDVSDQSLYLKLKAREYIMLKYRKMNLLSDII